MFTPLTIFCYVDKHTKNKNLKKWKDSMSENYPVNFIIEWFDGRDAEWTERNGKKYLSDDFNNKMCEPVFKKYGNLVDDVAILIDSKNWENTKKRLLGTQFGKRHFKYYVYSVKMWRHYDGTARHECLHGKDNYIKYYLGISLESVFKVKDFDDDVVHNRKYWKNNYSYAPVWKKLAPLLSMAIKKKRADFRTINIVSVTNEIKENLLLNSESIKEDKTFDTAFKHLMKWEGGYINDVNDKGGETKYGISKRSYPNVDIKALTTDKAKDIYYDDYWVAVRAPDLPQGLDLMIFDTAVNMGVKTAIKLLQEAVGTTQDGIIGNITLSAVKSKATSKVLQVYTVSRIQKYVSFSQYKNYGKGWLNRSVDTLSEAIKTLNLNNS